MKNLRTRLFSFILFVSPIIALSDFSINNSFGIGYDSNPLRLSNNEINQIPVQSSILKNAKYVHSKFFNLKSVLKFKSKSKIYQDTQTQLWSRGNEIYHSGI